MPMKKASSAVVCIVFVVLALFASQQRGAQSSTAVRIAPITAIGAIQPRISPDGSTIAVSYQGAIWTVPRTGGTMTRVTDGLGFDIEPAWSPDGKRIAFVRSTNMNGGDLYLIDASDGKQIALRKPVQVRGPYNFYKIYFHPDGQRLLGAFVADGKNLGLGWYDLATGDVKPLAEAATWNRYALSPDGAWIAYTKSLDVAGHPGGNDGPQADIFKLPAGGGALEKVARFPSRIHDLCWRADGKALVVVSELGGAYYDLWHVPFDDPQRGMRKLTFGQADEDRPSE